MNLILWIILGGVAGWLASLAMKTNTQQGIFKDVIFGTIGAFLGGLLFNVLGFTGITGFNLWSLLVATIGAIVVIAIGRTISRA